MGFFFASNDINKQKMKAGNTLRFMASIRRKEDAPEFGFGNSTNNAHQRALNPDGTAIDLRKTGSYELVNNHSV